MLSQYMLSANAPILQETAKKNLVRHPAHRSNILRKTKEIFPLRSQI